MKNVDKNGIIQEARSLRQQRAKLDEKVDALKRHIEGLSAKDILFLWDNGAKKAGGLDPEIRGVIKAQVKAVKRGWSMML
jgi:hypothetical protein